MVLLPELSIADWEPTRATLHMWMQIVGKVRLELAPHVNHWWEVPFYLTARGLTTSPIPYGDQTFDVEFDFFDHRLVIRVCDGGLHTMVLRPQSVADFYAEFMAALHSLGIDVTIWTTPVEISDPIPFEQDTVHASYDAAAVERFWRVLRFADAVLKQFRSGFIGKHSPVHFFWGSFDLASTRFSGRRAPEREWSSELAMIMREAYSHEVSSAGFWGGGGDQEAVFYAYHTPEPDGFKTVQVAPEAAFYHAQMGEFVLPYAALRESDDPQRDLLTFLQMTYVAGATLAKWDRAELER